MGQYYRFYLDNGKEQRVLICWDYDNTQKLMEHSYRGNYYCNAVIRALEEMGESHIFHLGDYAEGYVTKELYQRVWGTWDDEKNESIETPYKFTEQYDIDADRQVYIVCPKRGEYVRYCYGAAQDKHGDPLWYINTFALLTALPNGGGGSYYGTNMHMVGDWAGEKLYVTEEEPKDLKKIHGWIFREE